MQNARQIIMQKFTIIPSEMLQFSQLWKLQREIKIGFIRIITDYTWEMLATIHYLQT
jgi:hypothetical protein